jgi:hypothetical protein
VQGGDFAILGCLQANRDKISKACARVLQETGRESRGNFEPRPGRALSAGAGATFARWRLHGLARQLFLRLALGRVIADRRPRALRMGPRFAAGGRTLDLLGHARFP